MGIDGDLSHQPIEALEALLEAQQRHRFHQQLRPLQLRRPTGHNRKAITDFKAVDRTFCEWPLRIAQSRNMHIHILF